MTHVRTQISDAAMILLTGLPTTGANVFTGRGHTVPANKEPALSIRIGDEDLAPGAQGNPPIRMREAALEVEIKAKANTDVDVILNQILAEVETAIGNDRMLGGIAVNVHLTSIEMEPIDEAGSKRAGVMQLTFTVRYRTAANDPHTPK